MSANSGVTREEWRDRACRAEDRLRRIEPERDDYKASWLDEKARADELETVLKDYQQFCDKLRINVATWDRSVVASQLHALSIRTNRAVNRVQ